MWLDATCPAIAERATSEGAEIHWGDETALVNTDVRGRSYTSKGKTPGAMVAGGTRQKLSMLASVTNPGKRRWMIVEGNFNHEKLIGFFGHWSWTPSTRRFRSWTTWAYIIASR